MIVLRVAGFLVVALLMAAVGVLLSAPLVLEVWAVLEWGIGG